ncbi:PetM family of cytochrome b6f complex subunit 7 [Phreatobacter cathodiphilus]|uniref:PetM family of cytochrome b6f complex subunit 7 n=1 Tax=Phreatobacter cathodiphilus TaxID=1868589 RepID=A0A2S0NE14_9HYPH|nr:PetM family of cytochrome b6f complex subunit 7 [Phreatobacter cathodiphilus]AVO46388.1 PetM family of cytochrome b6f complex subunit 7 [Phreatobacter cathodiphilus]
MIRLPLRIAGFLVIAAGFVALVIDGTRSIAGQRLIATDVSEVWRSVHAASLTQIEAWLRGAAPDWVWDPVALVLLGLPAAAVGLALGALMMWLGRSREPQIGVIGRR